MQEIGRKRLPHEPPLSVDASREVFFLTICASERTGSPLLCVAPQLLESMAFYQKNGKWWAHLAVVMPDHVHLLVSFPPDGGLTATVRAWKHWTSRQLGVAWQRDLFDHRLRGEESLREKADYVLENPVRAGLVAEWEQWPHFWIAR